MIAQTINIACYKTERGVPCETVRKKGRPPVRRAALMRRLAEAPGQVDIRARAHLFLGLLALQFDAARGLPGESQTIRTGTFFGIARDC